MNPTLVISTLIFIFAALAIVIEINQINAASRARRIVVRVRSDGDAAPLIPFAPSVAGPGSGAFAGSPVSITGPARVIPAEIPVRDIAPVAAAAGSGSKRAVYDFVPPPPRKTRARNVHG